MTSRSCPGKCGRKVTDGHLACREHWFMLPPELRTRIAKEWHRYRKGRPNEYLGAIREAMLLWSAPKEDAP